LGIPFETRSGRSAQYHSVSDHDSGGNQGYTYSATDNRRLNSLVVDYECHLPDALEIVACWGFEYKVLLTWVKNRIGTGYWLRGRTEHAIMAVKGHPVINLTNQSTVIHAPVREHSQKPDEFYRLVETLCPGRKIELFARESRDGWDTWLTSANISRTVGL